MPKRCDWVSDDPLYIEYHDHEWGVPLRDDQKLFELLILEGAQAGLSWITVLKKRENYRRLFDGFNPEIIARYDQAKIEALMQDAGIIRNRLKINATVGNARAYLAIRERGESFSDFLWQFTGGGVKVNHWNSLKELPAKTAESDAMSKALLREGFKFVGSTICYAFMQATGMVNDHTADCFRYHEVGQDSSA
jgi:DNA-3-methyladenine glycosylase I